MRKHCVVCVVALTVLLGAAAWGQEPSASAGKGVVTGHVICGDTQRPARFATVALFGVPAQVTAAPKPDPNASEAEQMKALTTAFAAIESTNMVTVETGLDGSFVATDVAPGDYYVFGAAAGYVSPLNEVTALLAGGASLKLPLPGVPEVHVSADRESSVDVTMQRGAAISGTISWDDGSPVAGAIFVAVPVKKDAKPPTQFGMLAMAGAMNGLSAISDDLGHYRVTGLVPGDYILKASLRTGMQMGLGASSSFNLKKMGAESPLVVYAPEGFHKTDAKPITLLAGQEMSGEDVTLDLNDAHSVSGSVVSAEDHHGINQATVKLTDANDKDFVRSASVDDAGNFTVMFVPQGTYTMTVSDAADTVPKAKKKGALFNFDSDKTVRSYADGKQSVIVADSDVTGQVVSLAVDTNPKKTPDVGNLIDGMFGVSDAPKTVKLGNPQ